MEDGLSRNVAGMEEAAAQTGLATHPLPVKDATRIAPSSSRPNAPHATLILPTLMKSAYELAMERLEKQAPAVKLTAEQKAALAEVDSKFRARIAEREVFLKDNLAKAQAAGSFEDAAQIEQELAREVRKLQDDCEAEKEKLRRR